MFNLLLAFVIFITSFLRIFSPTAVVPKNDANWQTYSNPNLKFANVSPTQSLKTYSNHIIPYTFSYPINRSITEGDTIALDDIITFSRPHQLSSANQFTSYVQSQADKLTLPVSAVQTFDFTYPALGFIEDPGSANFQHIYVRPNNTSTQVVAIRYSTGFDYLVLPLLSTFKFIDPKGITVTNEINVGNPPNIKVKHLRISIPHNENTNIDWVQTLQSHQPSTVHFKTPDCGLNLSGGIGRGGGVGKYAFQNQKYGNFFYTHYAWQWNSTINAHNKDWSIQFGMSSLGTDNKNFNQCVEDIKTALKYINAEYIPD